MLRSLFILLIALCGYFCSFSRHLIPISSNQSMHKGFGLIYFKIGKIEMQKPSTGRKQCRAAHARISSASHFRPKMTPFCIFSNFTLDVILMSSYVYVISFVIEQYISSVKLVANESIWTKTRLLVPVFPHFFFSPIFFHFLAIQTRLDDDKSRHAWLKPLHP